MSRLPIPADSPEFSDETRAAVRHLNVTRGKVPAPSGFLTYAGKAGALMSDLVEHLRYHTTLNDAETELAICVAARSADSDYIWNSHAKLAIKAGVTEATLNIVDRRGALDGLSADEALIIRFGRELLDDLVLSDATYEAARHRYGEKGMMELAATMGAYLMNATVLRTVGHQSPGRVLSKSL